MKNKKLLIPVLCVALALFVAGTLLLKPAKATDTALKQKVQNLMGNSIDNFSSAEGSFVLNTKVGKSTIDYKVRLKGVPSGYEEAKSPNGTTTVTIYDGNINKLEKYNIEKKEYTSVKTATGNVKSEVKEPIHDNVPYNVKDRYSMEDNVPVYQYRSNPACMQMSRTSLFPQEAILGFLKDYNKWDITSSDKLLGYDTYVITGDLDSYYHKKLGTKFKWWVEKNTGILLKEEIYDSTGKVTESLETTSLKLNTNIDDKVFTKADKSEYKLVDPLKAAVEDTTKNFPNKK
ncbi:MAG: hypothetical protein QME45_12525 [Clostridiales bacterium]|nr:hypothetical protein [Clostridiales bacterium]